LNARRLRVDFESVKNPWKTRPDGEGYLESLRRRGHAGLADHLVNRYRPQVERWVSAAFERYGIRDRTVGKNDAGQEQMARRSN
jgi:hypothetical protein